MSHQWFPALILIALVAGFSGVARPSRTRLTASTETASDGSVVQEVDDLAGPQPVVRMGLPDPDLEPGFPIQMPISGGTYQGGPAVHTTLADLDGDDQLEIVVTALAGGSLWAWNPDGSLVSGWPSSPTGAGYAAAGNLLGSATVPEIVAGFWGGEIAVLDKDGSALAGWPRSSANFVTSPPALADVDGDGLDEIFLGEEDWKLHGYRADGTVLAGWPVWVPLGGQERHTPALGDLDGDGDLEIVSASGSSTPGVYLFAWHHDGTAVTGFPVLFPNGYPDTYPVIGDVDGDFAPEIVVVSKQDGPPWYPIVNVLRADGTIERQWTGSSTAAWGTAPALADLDGDTVPEIVMQSESHLEVWNGLGGSPPGWPVSWTGRWLGSSAPVVGDVTGDGLPNVVITTQQAGSAENGDVRAFDRSGVALAGFPKALPLGAGAVPAIGDVEGDGRNEIVVTGRFTALIAGFYDKIWMYDLGGADHGVVQWGQFGGGPRNAGAFAGRVTLSVARDALAWTADDAASGTDVVMGDLGLLRQTGGDFAAATLICEGDDVAGTSLAVFTEPGPGHAFWYLARPVTTFGIGSYESGGAGQVAPRDPTLAAASAGCP